MDSAYVVLADAVFALHLLFVLALGPSTALFCLGGYRKHPLLAQVHCVGIYAMAIGQTMLQECPLVLLERTLREAAGQPPWYYGSFSIFVVERITGFRLPVEVIFSLSTLVVTLTSAAFLAACLRTLLARRRPGNARSAAAP